MEKENIIIDGNNLTVLFATDKEVLEQRIKDSLAVLLVTFKPKLEEKFTEQYCKDYVNNLYQGILSNVQIYIKGDAYKDYLFRNTFNYQGLTGQDNYVTSITYVID